MLLQILWKFIYMHPIKIEHYETLEEVAIALGKMRYDKIAEFLKYFKEEMKKQQLKDSNVGKIKLAEDTHILIINLNEAEKSANYLFNRYKRYMEHEKTL